MQSVFDFLDHDPILSAMLNRGVTPRVTEETIEVDFEVPGFEAEELRLEFDSNSRGRPALLLSGEKQSTDTEGATNRSYLHKNAAHRSVLLPFDASVEDATATLKNGILTVTIKRNPKASRTTIDINT